VPSCDLWQLCPERLADVRKQMDRTGVRISIVHDSNVPPIDIRGAHGSPVPIFILLACEVDDLNSCRFTNVFDRRHVAASRTCCRDGRCTVHGVQHQRGAGLGAVGAVGVSHVRSAPDRNAARLRGPQAQDLWQGSHRALLKGSKQRELACDLFPSKRPQLSVFEVLLAGHSRNRATSQVKIYCGPPLVARRGRNSKPAKEHSEPETATWQVSASGCVVDSTPDRGRSLRFGWGPLLILLFLFILRLDLVLAFWNEPGSCV